MTAPKDIRKLKTKREEKLVRQILRVLECDCGEKECEANTRQEIGERLRQWFGIDGASPPSILNAFGLMRD